MASKVLYNGSAIATPGVYPTVVAGELSPLAVAATNVIAILGEAQGGVAISSGMTYDEVYEAAVLTGNLSQKVKNTFLSGDLREAAAFAASRVAASQMICMKVNQDLQASTTVPGKTESGEYFGDVITVETKASGAEQNNVQLALSGGINAVDLSLTAPSTFAGYPMSGTDVGDAVAFAVEYNDGAFNYGWDVCKAAITDSALLGMATESVVKVAGVTASNFTGTVARVTIANHSALNEGKIIRIYGLVGGEPAYDDVVYPTPSADGARDGDVVFDASGTLAMAIFASDGVTPSTVEGLTTLTLDDTAGSSPVCVLSSADTTGAEGMTRFYLAPTHPGTTFTAVNASGDTGDLLIFGRDASGALSGIALTVAGATPVESAAHSFVSLEAVVSSDISSTNATVLAAVPFQASFATYPTIGQIITYLNTKVGVSADEEDRSAGAAAPSTLDQTDGYVSLLTAASFYRTVDRVVELLNAGGSPVVATRTAWVPHEFTITDTGTQAATLTPSGETAISFSTAATADVVNYINRHPNSRFFMSAVATSSTVATVTAKTTLPIIASAVSGCTIADVDAPDGPGFFDATASLDTFYFVSGSAASASTSDYVTALEKLRDFDCDSIVVLSSSTAVHDALVSHLEYRAGRGGSESQGFIGIHNAADDDVPTKTEIRNAVRALNTRHLTVWGQALTWPNIAGTDTEFLPAVACIVPAALQAQKPIGTPISRTQLPAVVKEIRQDTSWDPREDSDEILGYGLTFAEVVPGGARRVVRHITAYLTDDNIAFVNGSVNRLVNYVVRTFRRDMEAWLAKPGTVKTVSNAKSYAQRRLDQFVRDGILVSWDSLTLSLSLDVLSLTVGIAPVVDINFILPTFYLKAANITV